MSRYHEIERINLLCRRQYFQRDRIKTLISSFYVMDLFLSTALYIRIIFLINCEIGITGKGDKTQ